MANISLRNAPRAERRLWGQGGSLALAPPPGYGPQSSSAFMHARPRLVVKAVLGPARPAEPLHATVELRLHACPLVFRCEGGRRAR